MQTKKILFIASILPIVFLYFFLPKQELKTQSFSKGGEFVLNGKDKVVKLSDFKGKVVPIYFGYTYCPDICPTELNALAEALNRLSEKELENIQPIFISVDPDRDKFPNLDSYGKYFHPKIISLTSDSKTIKDIAKRYGIIYKKVDLEDSAMGYVVDHTADTIVVGKDGNIKTIIPQKTPVEDIITKLKELLQ